MENKNNGNDILDKIDEKTKINLSQASQVFMGIGKRYKSSSDNEERQNQIMGGILILGGIIVGNTSVISLGRNISGGK